jgi:putative oxidoreductase
MNTKIQRVTPVALLLLRLVAGLLFFQAGALKLFGWYGGMPGGGTAPLFSLVGVAGVLEVFGGIALILGLSVRPVAFVLAGEMAVAYWLAHAPQGAWPIVNHGVEPVLFCFIFLYFAAVGGGPVSVDALIARIAKKRRVQASVVSCA